MRQKPECPHGNGVMCSCKALDSSRNEEKKIHFLRNLSDMRLELSYSTLAAPAPYCLCAAGVCKTCGGRLCLSIDMPAHLVEEGFLAIVLHHALRLDLKYPDQFVELFHKEDRPIVQQWLDGLETPGSRKGLPAHKVPAEAYTIVKTAVNADCGFFPDPFSWGCYLSLDLARDRLSELIAEEKKTLSDRYNKEERSDDCWEVCDADYSASCFVRIEILTSELVLSQKGGPGDA